jgi:hypothetical protein
VPPKGKKQIAARLNEAKAAVRAIVGKNWSEDEWEIQWKKISRILKVKDVSDLENSPTLEALLDWKDSIPIADSKWAGTCELFNLDDTRSLHYIKKLRIERDKNSGVKTSVGRGEVYTSIMTSSKQ